MSGNSSDKGLARDLLFSQYNISRRWTRAIKPWTGDPTEDPKDNPCELRFTNSYSGDSYRAISRYSEAFGNSEKRDDEVMKNIFFEWAVPDIVSDLSGPMLGESARVDGLQGCIFEDDEFAIVQGTAREDTTFVAAENNRALILWDHDRHDPLGTLAKLPLELRWKIYKRAFHRLFEGHFWQCYHTKRDGLSLLGISHTNPLPVVCALSVVLRNEVLDSVYREMATKIIIGGEVVAFNFPLNAGLRPCEPVDAGRAEVPLSKELFIGIQGPSPRNAVDADAVRSNVEEVVELLSSMNHPLPPIRVSFHTNADTRGCQYWWDDFEFFMGPFQNLRLPLRDPKLKPIHPFAIDRPRLKSNKLDEVCDKIERAVLQTLE
jgi:hypothetical protein